MRSIVGLLSEALNTCLSRQVIFTIVSPLLLRLSGTMHASYCSADEHVHVLRLCLLHGGEGLPLELKLPVASYACMCHIYAYTP